MKASITKKDRENERIIQRAQAETAANRERRKNADAMQKQRDADPTCSEAFKRPKP